jgi:hypothetical protein
MQSEETLLKIISNLRNELFELLHKRSDLPRIINRAWSVSRIAQSDDPGRLLEWEPEPFAVALVLCDVYKINQALSGSTGVGFLMRAFIGFGEGSY